MTSVQTFFGTLEHSALKVSLHASEWSYPLINTLHIVGIALLIGPMLILDWRLIRLRTTPSRA